jgi:2,3-dimethylmalate lyase
MKMTSRFRELLKNNEIIIAPGAPNALMARLVERAGFPVIYASGAGIANMQFGFADVGLVTMTEVVNQVKNIANAVNIPVIADADTGYGNALNVIRTVREFEQAGAAAIQLEDQIAPKKCGHFEGKQIVSLEEMVGKIKAAADARRDKDFVIIARTDARAVSSFEEAIHRSKAYKEAGADMIFLEAPQSKSELEEAAKRINAPLVANMVENGKTPIQSAGVLEEMGYKLVLYANMGMRVSIQAMQGALMHLKDHGSSNGLEDRMITMKERNALTDLSYYQDLEKNYLTL